MKRVLILGGFGFLGTNVMKYADENTQKEYRFIVFDKYSTHTHGVTFNCIDKVYSGDFSNIYLLEQIFAENKIDIIVHSLSTTVPVDSNNSIFDVESNLIPTLHILRLMTKYQINDIIYLSSGGAIYGMQNVKPHKETDNVYPLSSYGIVKLTIEKYLMQYAYLYGIRPLILRLSNPYGPYHYSSKQGVINIAIEKALNNECMTIWGDGNGKKDYFYVEDFANILFLLIGKGVYGKIINVASGQLLSVNEIVEEVKLFQPNFKTANIEASLFDTKQFELDTSELQNIIPCFSFTPFKEGFQKTLNWAKSLC